MKTGIARHDPAGAHGPLHLCRGVEFSDPYILCSLLAARHFISEPVSPPVISLVTSGPEATGAKNNISAVDRQPITIRKPKRMLPLPILQTREHDTGRRASSGDRGRGCPGRRVRAGALVTQVTEFSKVDIGGGMQHDRPMITFGTCLIAREGLLVSRLPLVLLTGSHSG